VAAQGQWAEGIAQIREGLAAWRARGTRTPWSWFFALLAEACGRAGQVEEGLRALEEALEAIVSDPERVAQYLQTPWKLEIDKVMWEHEHPDGLARAIREVIEDWPVPDRELLRKVTAPTLLICIEGDDIHPAELGRILHDLLPSSELLMFESEIALFQAIPSLVQRVGTFLTGHD